MDTPHTIITVCNDLIKNFQNAECIEFIQEKWSILEKEDLTKLYVTACKSANVGIIDYFLNCPLPIQMDIYFDYCEKNMYDPRVPNGAIFLAADNRNLELLEYFIKNEIYHIDDETQDGLKLFMPSVLKEIDQIEFKLHLEGLLTTKESASNKAKI